MSQGDSEQGGGPAGYSRANEVPANAAVAALEQVDPLSPGLTRSSPTPQRIPTLWPRYAAMIFANACWAIGIVGTKIALRSMPTAAFAEARAVGAAVLFLALFAFSPGQRFPRHLNRNDWIALAAMAASGISFSHILYCDGIARTSVVHTGLIAALGPAMVLLISCLLRIERFTALRAFGILLSFGGAALLTVSKANLSQRSAWAGDLLLMACGAFTSIYAILLKRSIKRFDTFTMNAGVFALGALFLLPIGGPASLRVAWLVLPRLAWAGLIFVTVMGSVVSYLINTWAMTELDPSQVQAFLYLQPVMAAAMGVLWMGEMLPGGTVLGGILIIVGVFLAARQGGSRLVGGKLTSGIV